MGDAVRREAIRRGLGLDAQTLAQLSRELRRIGGAAAIAELTVEQRPGPSVLVVEGVRSPAEVEYFRQHFERVFVVAIHCSPKVRFQRLISRRRDDDPRSWEEFAERDERELELGVGEVIALADFMLINEGVSESAFIEECVMTLKRILGECQPSILNP